MKRYCIGLAAVVVLVGVGQASATIVSWGRDDNNQVTNTPGGTGFTAIAAGGFHSLALTSIPEPSTLAIWGILGGLGMIADRRRRKRVT